MTGKTSKVFNEWRNKLLKILANVEAKIDFPEEDIPKRIINDMQKESTKVCLEISIPISCITSASKNALTSSAIDRKALKSILRG